MCCNNKSQQNNLINQLKAWQQSDGNEMKAVNTHNLDKQVAAEAVARTKTTLLDNMNAQKT